MKRRVLLLLFVLLLALPAASLSAATPWPHEGSDLKADPAVTWGSLPNGLRYAIMQHREPGEPDRPNRKVNLRLYVNAGSLMEEEDQQGLAHFLEHMAFNGTRHFAAGEMHRYFQHLGMSFGAHTNAFTYQEKTVYYLDLPADAYLDDALTLLRDYADGMLLQEKEIDKERGVILSEKLARDSAQYRTWVEGSKFFLPDSLLSRRWPIGSDEVIRKAARPRFLDFYRKWYTPDRMTLVAVGPVKPADLTAKLAAKFGSMAPPAKPVADPDLGKVSTGQGLRARLHVEKEAGKVGISISFLRPSRNRPDTTETRRQDLPGVLANQMLNRRLSKMTNGSDPPFLGASMSHLDQLKFVEMNSLELEAKPEGWEGALTAGMQELRRALKFGFTADEFREVTADVLAGLESAAEQASTRRSKDLADSIVTALAEGEVFTHPADDLATYQAMLDKATPEQCLEAMRRNWSSHDISIFVHGNLTLASAEAKIKEVFRKSLETPIERPAEKQQLVWAYSDFGSPGRVVKQEEVKDLGLTMVTLANNVRLTLKPTSFEKDTIRVNVNFGAGRLNVRADKPGLASFAADTFVLGGLEKHSIDDLQRLAAGKNVQPPAFTVGDEFFTLSGVTNRKDLAFQLQFLCAYLSAPGYRDDKMQVLAQTVDSLYNEWEHSAEGMFRLHAGRLMFDGDERFAFPTRQQYKARTMAELKAWMTEPLRSSWLEIGVVGDFDPRAVISDVAATFGALPERAASRPNYKAERQVSLTPPQDTVFRFTSRIPKALLVVSWPTTDSRRDIRLTRHCEVLADILSDRVMEKVREELGQAYSPAVFSDMSLTFTGKGQLICVFPCEARDAAKLGQVIRQLAGKLASEGATQDELDRAKKPRLKNDDELRRQNDWWMSYAVEAQSFPKRLDWARTRARDYRQVSLADVNRLAKMYLKPERSTLLRAVPEDEPSRTTSTGTEVKPVAHEAPQPAATK
jgi:zinc protease